MTAVETGNNTAIVVAVIALSGVLFTWVASYVVNRRKAKDESNLGVLTLGQQSLVEALDRSSQESAEHRDLIRVQSGEITSLRDEVRELRHKVTDALKKFEECETERIALTAEVADLRAQLDSR